MRLHLPIAAAAVLLSATGAQAQPAQGQFTVSMTVSKTCVVTNTGTLSFTPTDQLSVGNTTGSTTFNVQCTNATPYQIGLDKGSSAAGTTATRLMTLSGGTETVAYQLFQDASRTTAWGDTLNVNTKGGQAGNGAAQSHTVYGKVVSQTSAPAPGTYTDTVTITVTY